VHLWGAAKQKICINPRGCGGAGPPNLLGTLPPGPYTPQRNVFTIAHTNFGTYADVEIMTNGQIWLIDPRPPAVKDYSFVSLEGIGYNPSNGPSTQIQLNNGWAPDTRFNTIAPAAYADGGAVHLEGAAVLTTTPTPPNPTLLGTLPRARAGWQRVRGRAHQLRQLRRRGDHRTRRNRAWGRADLADRSSFPGRHGLHVRLARGHHVPDGLGDRRRLRMVVPGEHVH
jgi:hypothetical protein